MATKKPQEGRKSDEILFNVVGRIEKFSKFYSELTQEKINEQIARFREIATDEMIDQELMKVRLSVDTRSKIKQMLVKRRNDITDYYRQTDVALAA